jgi:hypothetical protein
LDLGVSVQVKEAGAMLTFKKPKRADALDRGDNAHFARDARHDLGFYILVVFVDLPFFIGQFFPGREKVHKFKRTRHDEGAVNAA